MCDTARFCARDLCRPLEVLRQGSNQPVALSTRTQLLLRLNLTALIFISDVCLILVSLPKTFPWNLHGCVKFQKQMCCARNKQRVGVSEPANSKSNSGLRILQAKHPLPRISRTKRGKFTLETVIFRECENFTSNEPRSQPKVEFNSNTPGRMNCNGLCGFSEGVVHAWEIHCLSKEKL